MSSDLQGATLSIKGRAYRPIMATYLAALWTAQNPKLQRGEIGIEQDTLLFKVGNGVDRWNDLGYATGSPGPQGPAGPQGPQGETGASGVSFTTTATIYDEDNPLPAFADTQVNTGYYYQNTNGIYDVYVHLDGESDWFVIENWGGIPGPQGIQGIQGIQGEQGVQGPQGNVGPEGPQGPAGTNALNFITQPGIYSASNPLPSFASVTEGDAYLFQNANDTYSLYAKAFGATDWTVINNYGGTEGPQGPQGPRGETGYVFTPSVNSAGDISWTNNGGLVNPQTQNIKGPQGNPGYYFTPAVSAAGDISWTNNGGLPNPQTQNIKGPQGETGPQGPQGDTGLVITDITATAATGVIDVVTSADLGSIYFVDGATPSGTMSGFVTGETLVLHCDDNSQETFTITATDGAITGLAGDGNGWYNENCNGKVVTSADWTYTGSGTGLTSLTLISQTSADHTPKIKMLFGGATIGGSWSKTSDAHYTFIPTNSNDIYANSWVITID